MIYSRDNKSVLPSTAADISPIGVLEKRRRRKRDIKKCCDTQTTRDTHTIHLHSLTSNSQVSCTPLPQTKKGKGNNNRQKDRQIDKQTKTAQEKLNLCTCGKGGSKRHSRLLCPYHPSLQLLCSLCSCSGAHTHQRNCGVPHK